MTNIFRSFLYTSASLLAGAAAASSQHHPEPPHGHHHGVMAPGYDPANRDHAPLQGGFRRPDRSRRLWRVRRRGSPPGHVRCGSLRHSPRSRVLRSEQEFPAREGRRGRRHGIASHLRRGNEPPREKSPQRRRGPRAPGRTGQTPLAEPASLRGRAQSLASAERRASASASQPRRSFSGGTLDR